MAYTPSSSDLAKLRKAVKAYNAAVDRLYNTGNFDYVPLKTNMFQEREFINSKSELNTRIKQLRRILTTEKPDAQTPVIVNGASVPKYMVDEAESIARDINSTRRALRDSLYPEWEEMSPQQKAVALSNRNLSDIDPEDYYTDYDLQDLVDEQYQSVMKKADVYISVWEDFNGASDIPDKIREMAENDPDGFKILMESPDIEKEIEYVYGDVGAGGSKYTGKSGFKYKRPSAFRGSMINRYSSAETYWREQYSDFLARRGYFA